MEEVTPKLIKDKGESVTSPEDIAQIINREQIAKVIRLHRNIPITNSDPITNYKQVIGDKKSKFNLKSISMNDLRTIFQVN